MTEAGWSVCAECGMGCNAVEYHPYAACLMFKQCHNSEIVRANLQAVRDDSYHQGRVAGLQHVIDQMTKALPLYGNDEYRERNEVEAWIRWVRIAQQAQGEKVVE